LVEVGSCDEINGCSGTQHQGHLGTDVESCTFTANWMGHFYSSTKLSCKRVFTWNPPKELQQKYEDPEVVKDLIRRKTTAGQYESNPDFPDSEDHQNLQTILSFHHSLYIYV